MKIFINEFVKIFSKKTSLILLMGFMLLNGLLISYNIYKDSDFTYSINDYKKFYNEIKGMSNEDAQQYADKKFKNQDKDMQIVVASDNVQNSEDVNTQVIGSLEEEVYNNIDNCVGYKDFLKSVDDKVDVSLSMNAFKDEDSFARKNLIKTKIDFKNVKDVSPDIGPEKGIVSATNSLSTDVFALIIIIFAIMTLITREKELDQLTLCRSTKKGRTALAVSKMGAIILTCLITLVVMYTGNFAISNAAYGFGDLSRPIQSVSSMNMCSYNISVLQYFIIFFANKLLIYILIASIIYLITVLSSDVVKVYAILFGIFGISSLCYYLIDKNSWLTLLRYINIMCYLNTSDMIVNYHNLNIFTFPINQLIFFIIIAISLILIFNYLTIIIFSEQKIKTSNKISITIPFIKTYKHTNLFLHECYKIFISGKVLFILAIFIAISFYSFTPAEERIYSYEDSCYKHYMLELSGEVTDKKLQFIKDEKANIQSEIDKLDKDISSGTSEEPYELLEKKLDNAKEKQKAINNVDTHTKYLQKTDGYYVYESGYWLLTGHESAGNKDIILAVIAMFMVILTTIYIYSIEYVTKANILLRCTQKGRSRTFICKLLIAIFIIAIIFVVTYIPYMYSVLKAYGNVGLSYPACSLQNLEHIPTAISIKEYLIIIMILRFIAMISAILIIFFTSSKLKSFIATIITSTLILILPLILSLLGFKIFRFLLLNPMILGNIFK